MNWHQQSVTLTVPCGPKVYGRVRRGGRVHIRRYGREIKNGLSLADLLVEAHERTRAAMVEQMRNNL